MEIDLSWARSIVTVAAFVTFVGIVIWAWSGARRERFEAAARLPLEGEDLDGYAGASGNAPARQEQESTR